MLTREFGARANGVVLDWAATAVHGPAVAFEPRPSARAHGGFTIDCFKGLGEMNPDQIWTATLDPQACVLLLERLEDVETMFSTFMGNVVELRRDFIVTNVPTVAYGETGKS